MTGFHHSKNNGINQPVILYDANGNPIAVLDDTATIVGQKGILAAGLTNAGKSKFLSVGASGALNVVSTSSGRNIVGEYLIASGLITGAVDIQSLISLENPLASGRTIYVNKVEINGLVTSNSSIVFAYKFGRSVGLPLGGDLLIPQKRRTIDLDTVAIVRNSPTAVLAGGSMWSTPASMGSVNGNLISNVFTAINTELERHELVISPGEAFVISAEANGTNWRHIANIVWCEEPI